MDGSRIMSPEELAKLDKSHFSTEGYSQKVAKPWGYEIIFTPESQPYTGKIMHVEAGKRQSLQVHDQKEETYYLASGQGGVIIEDKNGQMQTVEFEQGKGYTTKVGQKHRIYAVTDCDVWEVSMPETGTTYRLEDDYSRPDETEEVRKEPDRGWK